MLRVGGHRSRFTLQRVLEIAYFGRSGVARRISRYTHCVRINCRTKVAHHEFSSCRGCIPIKEHMKSIKNDSSKESPTEILCMIQTSDTRVMERPKLSVFHVIGGPETSAMRVLTIMSKMLDMATTELKWWRDGASAQYGDCKSQGTWMRYHPKQGMFVVPHEENLSAHNVFLLYYADNYDPSPMLDCIFDNGMLPLHFSNLVVPFAETILQPAVCNSVLSSLGSPRLCVYFKEKRYHAPLTIENFESAYSGLYECLCFEGRGVYKLQYHNKMAG